ncbi:MAG: cobalamin-independent methionine synthase II family protein [Lentisphaerae bacterium]|nr:cobalamin-independent methionine synthase II family protein [Lentisphaerota bacterium]
MKTTRTAALPPFYTHGIGSLPRPQAVLALLQARGQLLADEYEARMNDMVRFAIRVQEQAGMDVVSDGEWRRTHYIGEFLDRVGGFENVREFMHQGTLKREQVVVRRMRSGEPVFAHDGSFLAQHTSRVTKFALPSPFVIAIRFWHERHSREAYPTRQHFMEHLAELLHAEARALVQAGVDIIQLDDPALTYFCDMQLMKGETHDERLRLDWDIDTQLPAAVEAINHVVANLHAEVHLHCCHSVYKRMSDVRGDYKPILPRFTSLHVDRLNLEFAYQGTGNAVDLLLLPSHLDVGMGVVDVRTEQPQTVEAIEAIGAAGAEVIDPARIALNPDCGFAPGSGEPPTIDEAFIKMQRLCEAAARLRARFAVP